MRGTLIAFYTPAYTGVVQRLIDSAEAVGVDLMAQARPDRGEWELNCAQKPQFILESMGLMPTRPLLYVDADAIIRSDPWADLPGPDVADIGVHYRRRPGDPPTCRGELLSGTILINPTPAARRLITDWAIQQIEIFRSIPSRDQRTWDQKVLSACVDRQSAAGDLRVAGLGPEMTFIFDTMRRDHPGVIPVIEHFQHSRQIKAERAHERR